MSVQPDTVDLLIIGGGINGTAIARDAAGRGLSVVLCEKDDLASGTSSESTKLIHGGLRYLEKYDFALVRESLMEREVLLNAARHIIRPMRFILPHHKDLRPAWLLRVGLFIYDHIGGRKELPTTTTHDLLSSPLGKPLAAGMSRAFEYSDCWVDDARLVVLNALDAREKGARILTRTVFQTAERHADYWSAKLVSSTVDLQIRARALVNAAGPWLSIVGDHIPQKKKRAALRLVKGSHIIVHKLYDGDHAYLFQHADGRVVFSIPYEDRYTLIGTTDVEFNGKIEDRVASAQEISYLCELASLYFKQPVLKENVVRTYSGVRALLDKKGESASSVSREYALKLDRSRRSAPLLSVIGGKITTSRKLAEEAVNKLVPLTGTRTTNGAWTADAMFPGGELGKQDFESFLASQHQRYPWFSESEIRRLCRAYGSRLNLVLGKATAKSDLGVDYGCGFTTAELNYLINAEWATTLDDILWRRTKLGLHLGADAITEIQTHLTN